MNKEQIINLKNNFKYCEIECLDDEYNIIEGSTIETYEIGFTKRPVVFYVHVIDNEYFVISLYVYSNGISFFSSGKIKYLNCSLIEFLKFINALQNERYEDYSIETFEILINNYLRFRKAKQLTEKETEYVYKKMYNYMIEYYSNRVNERKLNIITVDGDIQGHERMDSPKVFNVFLIKEIGEKYKDMTIRKLYNLMI